ncbi:16S rRNA (cytidine(1402)-2'-O)-methyltransferase [soil metagenome]
MADLAPALYVVSTPIGNLGDVTYRAVEVLRAADVILAEDTRRTGTLLRHYHIQGRLVSAHEHNERRRAETVVEMLREGRSVALVSDAGTPLLSDPGARIARAVLEAGYDVVPIPGASALLAALVSSGLPAERFTFYGFIPRKGGPRRELLGEIAGSAYAAVVYESPHRLTELLADLAGFAGADRRVAVARELTKLHEEVVRGTLGEVRERFDGVKVKGEIAVVLEGRPESGEADMAPAEDEQVRALALGFLARGMSPSRAARELQQLTGVPRNAAYELMLELAREGQG